MSSWAGPWVLFKGGTGGSELNRWRGSVLILTSDEAGANQGGSGAAAAAPAAAAAAGPAASSAAEQAADKQATAAAAVQQPGGSIEDGPSAATGPAEEAAAAAQTAAAAAAPGAAARPPPPTLQVTDETASGKHTLQAVRLDAADGWTFWRFDLQLELTAWQVGAGVHGKGGLRCALFPRSTRVCICYAGQDSGTEAAL